MFSAHTDVLSLPFVTNAWQIYVLIVVLQVASATCTPAFQALIPEVLPRESEYTRALSLSRLAEMPGALLGLAPTATMLFSLAILSGIIAFRAWTTQTTSLAQGESMITV